MAIEPLGRASVRSLVVNGKEVSSLFFDLEGPRGDFHAGFRRQLSGHDTEYRKRYDLPKGTMIANTRTWTGLASEEVREVEEKLSCRIPPGVLLENFILEGFSGFSRLKPGSQLVFPKRMVGDDTTRAALLVFEQNGPCGTVGARLAKLHARPELTFEFVKAAADQRGLMGTVHVAGLVEIYDEVLIYPPVA